MAGWRMLSSRVGLGRLDEYWKKTRKLVKEAGLKWCSQQKTDMNKSRVNSEEQAIHLKTVWLWLEEEFKNGQAKVKVER